MLFLLRAEDGSVIYLLRDKQYSVGRKDCDIRINNDQSVSRKHAALSVQNNKVVLMDCGSRYNTFIDGAKIEANTEVPLHSGNIVRFGMLRSIYIFEETKIVTTTSSIKSDQKANLRNNVNFLGGCVAQNWSLHCSHITVEEIMLTVKVLCAIITGIPIVTLKYWDDYVECVKQNMAPPDVADYKPTCSETMVNKNISLHYRPERQQLFKNKIFVFPNKSDKAKMENLIKLAGKIAEKNYLDPSSIVLSLLGGEATSWDINPLKPNDINSSANEYIILQTTEVSDTKANEEFTNIVSYLNQMGKRTIPLQEIALAIVHCSCEKDCNPSFDRKGIVLSTTSQVPKHTENILALPSQSQSLIAEENVKTELIVPHSLDNYVIINSIDKVDIIEETLKVEEKPSTSMKREGDSIENLNAQKKIKMETNPFFVKGTLKKETPNTSEVKSEPVKVQRRPSGKTLFAFKRDKLSNESSATLEPSNKVFNPFAKKRKALQSEVENPPKKPAADNILGTSSLSHISSSNISGRLKENPFANIIKSKSPERSANSSLITSNPRSEQTSKPSEYCSASSMVNKENVSSVQADFCITMEVDSCLEKSYEWISKCSDRTINGHQSEINGHGEEADAEYLKYIEAFRNTVIIEEEELIVKKSAVINNNNTSIINKNVKNFKTFKKVQPLKTQTRIIPESTYINVVCNHNCAVPLVQEDSDDENDVAFNSQRATRKQKGKRYQF